MMIFKFVLLFIWFLLTLSAQSQFIKTRIEQKDLPKNLYYKGQLKEAYNWSDKDGDHITLITETGELRSKNEQFDNYRDAELFAYDFLLQKDCTKQNWRIYDFVKSCPVDIKANFVKNTFQITDLNNDGKGEIWIMYKVACYGDISPSEMKIIMYHGQQKFAMRGRSKVKLSETENEGGEYKFDNAFINGPKIFREFAKQLWNNNLVETWE
jgi:hypothetical protein